jgi:hypothetical protein
MPRLTFTKIPYFRRKRFFRLLRRFRFHDYRRPFLIWSLVKRRRGYLRRVPWFMSEYGRLAALRRNLRKLAATFYRRRLTAAGGRSPLTAFSSPDVRRAIKAEALRQCARRFSRRHGLRPFSSPSRKLRLHQRRFRRHTAYAPSSIRGHGPKLLASLPRLPRSPRRFRLRRSKAIVSAWQRSASTLVRRRLLARGHRFSRPLVAKGSALKTVCLRYNRGRFFSYRRFTRLFWFRRSLRRPLRRPRRLQLGPTKAWWERESLDRLKQIRARRERFSLLRKHLRPMSKKRVSKKRVSKKRVSKKRVSKALRKRKRRVVRKLRHRRQRAILTRKQRFVIWHRHPRSIFGFRRRIQKRGFPSFVKQLRRHYRQFHNLTSLQSRRWRSTVPLFRHPVSLRYHPLKRLRFRRRLYRLFRRTRRQFVRRYQFFLRRSSWAGNRVRVGDLSPYSRLVARFRTMRGRLLPHRLAYMQAVRQRLTSKPRSRSRFLVSIRSRRRRRFKRKRHRRRSRYHRWRRSPANLFRRPGRYLGLRRAHARLAAWSQLRSSNFRGVRAAFLRPRPRAAAIQRMALDLHYRSQRRRRILYSRHLQRSAVNRRLRRKMRRYSVRRWLARFRRVRRRRFLRIRRRRYGSLRRRFRIRRHGRRLKRRRRRKLRRLRRKRRKLFPVYYARRRRRRLYPFVHRVFRTPHMVYLHIRRVTNNFFYSIFLRRRMLMSFSNGRTEFVGSRRASGVACEAAARRLAITLRANRIRAVYLLLDSRFNYFSRVVLRILKANRFWITGCKYRLRRPHGAKPRRRASRRV